jgi:hypothetical protein
MCPHRDTNDDMYHSEPVAISPNRPPQYNSDCGYHCGWGCEPRGEDGEGGDHESNTTTTLVGSEDESMEELHPRENFRASLSVNWSVSERNQTETGSIMIMDGIESSYHLSRYIVSRDDPNIYSHSQQSYGESINSLENEASSGPHSSAASDARSNGTMSPTGLLAGAGTWDERNEADRFPLEHHFLVRPLRLSPQFEHCRGNPIFHKVAQDEIVL